MKNFCYTLLAAVLLSYGCSKNESSTEPKIYQEEFPMRTFLSRAGLTVSQAGTSPASQKGIEFTPKVNGKLKALTFNYPGTSIIRFKMTVWDSSTKAILAQQDVHNYSTNTNHRIDIAEIELKKNKMYCISIDLNNLYNRKLADESKEIIYPVDCDNVTINSFKTHSTYGVVNPPQAYPETLVTKYFYGDFGIVFQQTN